ncbi:glycosyltransferase family 4 protein [Hymenobacter sp. BT770]|uniref:glycosyltransferase family 4 protein n=1 Tax=Hymenobacter sp. BT770 TaxID=2886942 RepID=UPI001D11853D|nr:glycosyltransferase family 4 protein [Hymenobacter sp. BT770]MCC3153808.1 glycosyltransferase family 4 protein [Hymenobacter sp. BT770]MDO3415952.1 glycosyltransferase family 4 protein [Hymenobacter sp. BT770]
MKKILFISHEATRTGAPIVLLHLIRWLKEQTDLEPSVLILKGGGDMQVDFEQIANTFVWRKNPPMSRWKRNIKRLLNERIDDYRDVKNELRDLAPNLIYANTIVTLELATELSDILRCPVMCHVHELQLIIQESIGNDKFTKLAKRVNFFIAASEAVSINLIKAHNVSEDKVAKVHEFIPVLESAQFEMSRQNIRNELCIPENALLVMASGTIEWRKSPDLFIQVAQQVQEIEGQTTYFIWVGGGLDSYTGVRGQYDLARAGLNDKVKFIGQKTNIHEYMSGSDIFLLTSREDAYPLVCLEAASLGKPIICFKDSGGMPEFVETDCGIVVPYLRTDIMAQAVVRLSNDKTERLRLGTNGARKMRARHTVDISANEIVSLIRKFL